MTNAILSEDEEVSHKDLHNSLKLLNRVVSLMAAAGISVAGALGWLFLRTGNDVDSFRVEMKGLRVEVGQKMDQINNRLGNTNDALRDQSLAIREMMVEIREARSDVDALDMRGSQRLQRHLEQTRELRE